MLTKERIKESLQSVLSQINPEKLLLDAIEYKENTLFINSTPYPLPKSKKITLLGSGKAVQSMAKALYTIMGDTIEKSVLVGPYEATLTHENLHYIQSTHPIPSQKSLQAAQTLKNELEKLSEEDTFIYLLSGGNSALVELPAGDITLEDFQYTTALMLQASMPIEVINCVRKHLSAVKGGGLSTYTKATGYIIVLSDVLGDSFEDIGSAPLYCDTTTFADAYDFVKEYEIFAMLPLSVKKHILDGVNKNIPDTPKEVSLKMKHHLIGSNSLFLESISEHFLHYGVKSKIYHHSINDDVDIVCTELIKFCLEETKGCFIFGGEATVKVEGNGKGGRNQHLVLEFLDRFPKEKEIIFASVASDGIDGNSDAAGAIVNKDTLQEALEKKINIKYYLKKFDSNSFLNQTDSLISTGPTHNNMLDAVIVYIQ